MEAGNAHTQREDRGATGRRGENLVGANHFHKQTDNAFKAKDGPMDSSHWPPLGGLGLPIQIGLSLEIQMASPPLITTLIEEFP